jgi:hypothetical protein
MGFCKWFGVFITTFFAIVFFVIGGIAYPVIDDVTKSMTYDKMVMTESQADTWGLFPGHTDVKIHKQFYLFNVLNPEDVKWRGAKPRITQSPGYKYQETLDFVERIYENHDGEDDAWVKFKSYQWYDATHDWPAQMSAEDQFTTINLGAFSIWDNMKRQSPNKVALTTLNSIIQYMSNSLVQQTYAQGLIKYIGNYANAKANIYAPAGVSDNDLCQALWSDENYGWSNWRTLTIWVVAYQESLVGDEFKYSTGKSGTIYMLKAYFGLTDDQMKNLLGLKFDTFFKQTGDNLKSQYGCTETVGRYCTPHYLAALQWSTQTLTMNPPVSYISSNPSVTYINSTMLGFPEISYFTSQYYTRDNPLSAVTWTIDDGMRLLNYNLTTGWPSGSPNTLLDFGHITLLMSLGQTQNWSDVQDLFKLASPSHANVLYDYVNALVSVTALQGRTNALRYDLNNRGLTSELAMGYMTSQAILSVYSKLAAVLPSDFTARYAYAILVGIKDYSCTLLLSENGVDPSKGCVGDLDWDVYNGIEPWILAYWYGSGSPYWSYILSYTGLTEADLQGLYSPASTLVSNFSDIDAGIKSYYNCKNPGTRCFEQELVELQWGGSLISNNLPTAMSYLGMSNSSSIYDWGAPYTSVFSSVPEYSAYAISKGGQVLDQDTTHDLLNYMSLFNKVQDQIYFNYVFDNDMDSISSIFQISDVATMTAYMRYAVDQFALGGLFITKPLNWLFWNGNSELLKKFALMNPLEGGDPALDPTSIQLGKNTTKEMLNIPDKYSHAMWSAYSEMDHKNRWWVLRHGSRYSNVFKKVYYGHDTLGPIIKYDNINPWKKPCPLMGSDGLAFQTDVDSGSDIYYFNDELERSIETRYDKEVYHYDLLCYRFIAEDSNFESFKSNSDNDVFYSYGPDGLINATSVYSAPVFASKPYFYGGDDKLLKILELVDKDLGDLSVYETFFDVEHYTGAVFKGVIQTMTTVELKPDVLYPNLGLAGRAEQQINTYLPIYYMNKTAQYSDYRVFLLFNDIKVADMMALMFTILGFLFGAIFLIVAIGMLIYHCVMKAVREKPKPGHAPLLMMDIIGEDVQDSSSIQ